MTQDQLAPPDPTEFFNSWRKYYDSMSFEDQMGFYDVVAKWWPDQAAYNVDAALEAIEAAAPDAIDVVEIGGWQGDLANEVLAHCPKVSSWTNYDLCRWAIDNPHCDDSRYGGLLLSDWPWKVDLEPADIFVATHVIEHMRGDELNLLLPAMTSYPSVHLQAPIPDVGPMDWSDYRGSHILEAGWTDIDVLFADCGFSVSQIGRLPSNDMQWPWPMDSWRTYRGLR